MLVCHAVKYSQCGHASDLQESRKIHFQASVVISIVPEQQFVPSQWGTFYSKFEQNFPDHYLDMGLQSLSYFLHIIFFFIFFCKFFSFHNTYKNCHNLHKPYQIIFKLKGYKNHTIFPICVHIDRSGAKL